MDPIVVAGLPRSGTSWVAKGLSFAAGYSYYREPDNFDHVPGASPSFRWTYLPPGSTGEALGAQLTRALRGEERHSSVMDDPGPLLRWLPEVAQYHLGRRWPSLYLPKDGVLAKLVFSNLALGWISDAVERCRVVPVLRHPCGTYASWRRLGWTPEPARLLCDDALVRDHLEPYIDVIAGADGFWERAGAEWAAVALVLTNQLSAHPDWVVVQHEWLCVDPVAGFRALYAALDLPWEAAAEQFVRASDRPGDDRQRSLTREARREADKWRRELDAEDIAACRRSVDRFELPWYPGFEPVAAVPAWAGA